LLGVFPMLLFFSNVIRRKKSFPDQLWLNTRGLPQPREFEIETGNEKPENESLLHPGLVGRPYFVAQATV
jgi:hypothetical protein